jgi:hypothetical protein
MTVTWIKIAIVIGIPVAIILILWLGARRERRKEREQAPEEDLPLVEIKPGNKRISGVLSVDDRVLRFDLEWITQDERWIENGIPAAKGVIRLGPLTQRLGGKAEDELIKAAKRPEEPLPKAMAESVLRSTLEQTLRVQRLPEKCLRINLVSVGWLDLAPEEAEAPPTERQRALRPPETVRIAVPPVGGKERKK